MEPFWKIKTSSCSDVESKPEQTAEHICFKGQMSEAMVGSQSLNGDFYPLSVFSYPWDSPGDWEAAPCGVGHITKGLWFECLVQRDLRSDFTTRAEFSGTAEASYPPPLCSQSVAAGCFFFFFTHPAWLHSKPLSNIYRLFLFLSQRN